MTSTRSAAPRSLGLAAERVVFPEAPRPPMRSHDSAGALARAIADFAAPPIIPSRRVPRTQLLPHVDFDDRLHAMTAHHIDLSLLDLVEEQPCAIFTAHGVFVHPDNLHILAPRRP